MDQDGNKQQAIKDIVEISRALSQTLLSPDLEQWRKLSVPVAQLKSLCLIVKLQNVNSRILAGELGVTPGNVTGIVDRLAEQDLVSRRPDPGDRRVVWLEATPKGRELLEKLVESHSRKMSALLETMSIKDLEALLQGMRGVLEAIETHQESLKNTTLES